MKAAESLENVGEEVTRLPEQVESLGERLDTLQEMVSVDLPEQIARVYEQVTGIQSGPGGTDVPFSLADIGIMLAGLQSLFEPQLKVSGHSKYLTNTRASQRN